MNDIELCDNCRYFHNKNICLYWHKFTMKSSFCVNWSDKKNDTMETMQEMSKHSKDNTHKAGVPILQLDKLKKDGRPSWFQRGKGSGYYSWYFEAAKDKKQ